MNTTPTLHAVSDEISKAELLAMDPATVKEVVKEVIDFFRTGSLTGGIMSFMAKRIQTDDGTILDNFEAIVTARFVKDGNLHIVLSTGDVVDVIACFNPFL